MSSFVDGEFSAFHDVVEGVECFFVHASDFFDGDYASVCEEDCAGV